MLLPVVKNMYLDCYSRQSSRFRPSTLHFRSCTAHEKVYSLTEMKQVLVLLFTVTLASSQFTYKTDPLWLSFKNDFNKTNYSSPAEESLRYQIFLSNVAYINATNSRNVTSQLAINKFADLTFQEFKSLYLGFVPAPADQLPNATGTFTASSVGGNLPAYVDWRKPRSSYPCEKPGSV